MTQIQFPTSKEDKGHSITCHEDTEGENRYKPTCSLTLALDGWYAPASLLLGKTGVIAQETGCAPQLVHTGFENLTPIVIHTPNC